MLTRRSMAAASLLCAAPRGLMAKVGHERLPLWPGRPPGGGGPLGGIVEDAEGAVTNVSTPCLEIYAPERSNGSAVLVAAGGGYKRIEMGKEARPAAQWLAGQGVTAFVLTYRLPTEGWSVGPLAPLQDAQRALRIVRSGASRRGLDPDQIGVMGFSSGGHLFGLAATRSAFHAYPPLDAIDQQSARPRFAALIYPVVTLEPPYDHTSTRRSLVGAHPTPEASAEWSVETHVRSGCPPMFLAQALDDPISNPQNSVILCDACKAAGVPVELHQFTTGGHGFALGRPGAPTAAWPELYRRWRRADGSA